MTQEQYERVTQINKRLEELGKVKKEIQQKSIHRLSYMRESESINSSPQLCSRYIMRYIGEILDRHDEMIRAEIDEEMRALKKEIESL